MSVAKLLEGVRFAARATALMHVSQTYRGLRALLNTPGHADRRVQPGN